jgi:hypothetical protein
MSKKIIISVLAVCFVFSSLGIAFAEGNSRKGKYAYRNLYKSCHEKGLTDSAKPSINPDAKTKAQWKRVFDSKDFTELGCTDEWTKLTDEELLDIHAYLESGAADSETPAKCK